MSYFWWFYSRVSWTWTIWSNRWLATQAQWPQSQSTNNNEVATFWIHNTVQTTLITIKSIRIHTKVYTTQMKSIWSMFIVEFIFYKFNFIFICCSRNLISHFFRVFARNLRKNELKYSCFNKLYWYCSWKHNYFFSLKIAVAKKKMSVAEKNLLLQRKICCCRKNWRHTKKSITLDFNQINHFLD